MGSVEDFGRLLRRYRSRAGLSQDALAARSGISKNAISMLERGVRLVPRNVTIARLAAALHLSPPERDALLAAAQRPRDRSNHVPKVPHELPRSPAGFSGREPELAVLHRLLDAVAATTREQEPVVISAISGMGGIGKSALAIHAAHLLAPAFPDGQLYVNLQGETDGLQPLEPLDALGRMLRSLGLTTLPTETQEAAARFRSLAAERRLLVLLDNARSADQVRPLLPGSPNCGVLVTSRRVLATLEGTQQLPLDVLPEEDGLELLGRLAGQDRIASEPQAAADVVRWCGGLPLAIRIAGARLLARPNRSLQELAARLADEIHRLEELQAGELAVRASFDVSLRAMEGSTDAVDHAAAHSFGLLSLPDGPDLSLAAAARLLGKSEAQTESLLERLVDAQLLETPRTGRYVFHDLVRVYAREYAALQFPLTERRDALARIAGFYAATAWGTLAVLRPGNWRLATADQRWTNGLEFADAVAALRWLEDERANMLSAISQAAAGGTASMPPELPSQLVRALYGFFNLRGYPHDWIRAGEAALEVGRRLHDREAQAIALNDLGSAYWMVGDKLKSFLYFNESISIYQELNDAHGIAMSTANMGLVYAATGRCEEAVTHHLECLKLFKGLGDREAEANHLISLGEDYLCTAEYSKAIDALRESIRIFRDIEILDGQARALDSLGNVYVAQKRFVRAIAYYRRALTMLRSTGYSYGYMKVLRGLGEALHLTGDNQRARMVWEDGLAIAEDLHIRDADEIRAKLKSLEQ